MVAAQGLDLVRPLFSPSGTRLFTLVVEVILRGKSPGDIIRYICWTYLSGYNPLKEAVTGHLLWQQHGSLCFGIPSSQKIVNYERAGIWLRWTSLTIYTTSCRCPKDNFCPIKEIHLILATPPKMRLAEKKRSRKTSTMLSVTVVLIFLSSLSPNHFSHHTIAYNLKLRDTD